MDLRYLCNCNDCNSVLVTFGRVIILCDIPTKLLSSYNSELIYSKFSCNAINIILITNVKSFLGLNLLNKYFNLSSTHVITTSPIFSLSTVLTTTNGTNGVNTHTLSSHRINKVINNVREKNYKYEYKLHIISFNQFLTLITSINIDNNIDDTSILDVGTSTAVEMEIVGYSNGYNFGGCNYMLRHGNVSEKLFIVSNSSLKNDIYKSFNSNIFQHTNPNDFILFLSTPNQCNTNNSVDVTGVENTVEELVNKIMTGNIILIMDILDECLIEILLELCNRITTVLQQYRYVYCVGTGVEELFDFYNKSCEWVNESRAENTMDPNDPNPPFPELTNLTQNNILLIANHMKDIVNIYKSPSITFLFHPYNSDKGINTDNSVNISNSVNKVYVINNTNDKTIISGKNSGNIEYIRVMRKNDMKEIIKEFESRKGKIILNENLLNLDGNTLTFEENFVNFGLTKLKIPIKSDIKFKPINSKMDVGMCKMTDGMLMGCDQSLEIPFGTVKVEKVLKELKRAYNDINVPDVQMNKELLIRGKSFELKIDEVRNEILINTTNTKDFNTLNKLVLNLFTHYSYLVRV
ncbi:hypothetical protein TpMuguga_01g00631 [Theileria parva strain Muguga]|nr:uncharacterized protein TpMuguga_01g00631 [Theileria parva strain Muguga]EAN33869.2 hypothetical protein TpMuguga_01g00631 [Theileria parva strain Muguga]